MGQNAKKQYLMVTWVELLVEKDFGSASSPTDSYTFEYA